MASLQKDNYNDIFKHIPHWNKLFDIFIHLSIHIALFKERNSYLVFFYFNIFQFEIILWDILIISERYLKTTQTWKVCVILLHTQQQRFMNFRSIITLQQKGRFFISFAYITEKFCFEHRKNTLESSPYSRKQHSLLMQEKKTRDKKHNMVILRHGKIRFDVPEASEENTLCLWRETTYFI